MSQKRSMHGSRLPACPPPMVTPLLPPACPHCTLPCSHQVPDVRAAEPQDLPLPDRQRRRRPAHATAAAHRGGRCAGHCLVCSCRAGGSTVLAAASTPCMLHLAASLLALRCCLWLTPLPPCCTATATAPHHHCRCTAGAGIVGMSATYPLDMVRGRITVQEAGAGQQYRGLMHATGCIIRCGAGGRAGGRGEGLMGGKWCSGVGFVAVQFAAPLRFLPLTAHTTTRTPPAHNTPQGGGPAGAVAGVAAQRHRRGALRGTELWRVRNHEGRRHQDVR